MCCFSGTVSHVSGTRIFARAMGDDQVLAYAMSIATHAPVAMVLPIPVARPATEDAVRFVDLSGYPKFFEDLGRPFEPRDLSAQPMSRAPPPATLAVHRVGNIVASFVPTVGDFGRLDARFRLPASIVEALGAADAGFVVFQMAATTGWFGRFRAPKPADFHPMAFVFPRRDPSRLFFPTLHVHDGLVHPTAAFDHHLYAQGTLG